MHAPGQPEDLAGRQRRPHAAEHDDDESGATALMEGVGATAYGRLRRDCAGKRTAATEMRGSLPVEGSHVGKRQQYRRAISFLGAAPKAGGQATREINTGLRSYVPTYLV
jgi:hypothetical protein